MGYSLNTQATAKQQLPINVEALKTKLAPYGVAVELGGKTKRRTVDARTGKDLAGCEGWQKLEFSGPIAERDDVHHGNVDPDYRTFKESQDPAVALAGKLYDAGAGYDSHADHYPRSKCRERVWYYEQHPVEICQFIVGLIAAL